MNVQFGGGTVPRVCHREFIGPVYGSANFNTTPYRIQPGLRGVGVLFPWASSVANCFTQYRLRGMILEYKTTSTNYSSQVGLGSVMMSTQYDAEASPLPSQIAVDNNEFTTSDAPSQSFIHPIECASGESAITVRYVQANNSSGGTDDQRFNDVGIFQISTIGQTDSAGLQIGELWASYDIEFLKPALPDVHAGTAFSAAFYSNVSDELFIGANVDQASSYPVKVQDALNLTLPVGYAGNYLVNWQYLTDFSLGSACSPPLVASSGSDVTFRKIYPGIASSGTVLTEFNSTNYVSSNNVAQNQNTVVDLDTNTPSIGGWCGSFTYTTIAESLVNNTLSFQGANWGGSNGHGLFQLQFVALDNDIPSGNYAGTFPLTSFINRKGLRRAIIEDVQKVRDLESARDAMRATVASQGKQIERLMSLLTEPSSPREFSPDGAAKDSVLDSSVHVSRAVPAKHASSSCDEEHKSASADVQTSARPRFAGLFK
jgi:hypothetical protein